MSSNTFGWVQDAGQVKKIKTLLRVMNVGSRENIHMRDVLLPKYIVDEQLLARLSETLRHVRMSYNDLKGRNESMQLSIYDNIRLFGYLQYEAEQIVRKGGRGNAQCSGIAQLCFNAQKIMPNGLPKPYIADWPTDSFLRFAVSVGFIDYDYRDGTCGLTEDGKLYIETEDGSEREKELLILAILRNPPACRVLELLVNNNEPLTKFEIGKQLGFLGEAGFTSIPQNVFVSAYTSTNNREERSKIKQNVEGSSDKYARMIAGWFEDLGLVRKTSKHVYEEFGNEQHDMIIEASYIATLDGRKYAKHIRGQSSFPRTPKIVYFEMLATKAQGAEYLRKRRTVLLQSLKSEKSLAELVNILERHGIIENIISVKDDVSNFCNIGLEIRKMDNNKYKLMDKIICLREIAVQEEEKPQVLIDKDYVRSKLINVDHRYLELIDLAYDGKSNLQFEIMTISLFCDVMKYSGKHLGGGSKPDGIAYCRTFGIIMDTKAYSNGFSLPIHQADEMVRYIDDNKRRGLSNPTRWWTNFPNSLQEYCYLFVSSFLTGSYMRRVYSIKERTGYDGALISARNLLLLAEKVSNGRLSTEDCLSYFRINREVVENDFGDIESFLNAAEPINNWGGHNV